MWDVVERLFEVHVYNICVVSPVYFIGPDI